MASPPRVGEDRLRENDPGVLDEVFSKLPESAGYPVMEPLVITFWVGVVSCAMLAIPFPGIIGLPQTSTEAAGLKSENVSNVSGLRKEKEFPKKQRLNAQDWLKAKGISY